MSQPGRPAHATTRTYWRTGTARCMQGLCRIPGNTLAAEHKAKVLLRRQGALQCDWPDAAGACGIPTGLACLIASQDREVLAACGCSVSAGAGRVTGRPQGEGTPVSSCDRGQPSKIDWPAELRGRAGGAGADPERAAADSGFSLRPVPFAALSAAAPAAAPAARLAPGAGAQHLSGQ